jgi:hypothetical protein
MATAHYTILGQSAPTSTTEAILYTVPGGREAIVSTVTTTCLATSGSVKVRLNVCKTAASSSNANALWYDLTLYPGQAETLTLGIGLAATDTLRVKTDTANGASFQAFGTEIY